MASPMLRRLSSAKKGSSWLSSVSRSVRFGSTEATSDCLLFSSQARRKAYANMLAMTAVAASGAVGAACLADAAQRNGFPPATVAYAEDDMSFPLHDEAHAKQQENSQGGQAEASFFSRLSSVTPVRMSDEAHEMACFCQLVAWD